MSTVNFMSTPGAVVFLQNAWFHPKTDKDYIDKYHNDVEFRRLVLAKSMTGSRLLKAFGEEWYGHIWWDNCTTASGHRHHRDVTVPDPKYMAGIVTSVAYHFMFERGTKLAVVGLMSKNAIDTFPHARKIALSTGRVSALTRRLWDGLKIVKGRHPNAMGIKMEEIVNFADQIKEGCK